MDFLFTEEQDMFRDSISRYVREKYDFETRQKIIASTDGWSKEVWADFAEMGLLSVPFAEEYDGLGGGAVDIMVIMEELGKGNIVEPFLPTVVLGGGVLSEVGGEQAKTLIPQIATGELIVGFGVAEPRSRFDLFHVEASAKKDGDSYVLNGRKAVVLGAPIADKLILSCRTSGNTRDEDGISLFVVDAKAEGVTIESYSTIDGHRAGDVILEDVKVTAADLLGEEGKALPIIEKVTDQGISAIAAEAMGVCRKMTELTTAYTRERKQFGTAISNFQVLQHRMVDMLIHTEEMISMAYLGALKLDEHPDERKKILSAVKVQLGKSVKFCGESAIQLHGGMGMTEEMAVAHYFMHGTMLDVMFGNADHHRKRYESLM